MAHLIAHAQKSATDNAIAGNLVKARCDWCGKKFGSLEEAKRCESKHIARILRDVSKNNRRTE